MQKQIVIHGNVIRPRVRVALVGAGGRTTSFLRFFSQNTTEGEIVGVSDLVPEKARILTSIYKVSAEIFDDTEKMLEKTQPDAVFICTPDYAHTEPVVAALQAKINVFCEKPMATTLEDCDTIIATAKKSSAVFYLGFNLRHSPVYVTLYELIQSGRLGKITTIEASEYYYDGRTYFRRWNRLEKFGGGLWVTKACHDFDILNWMAGAEPQTVYAVANLSYYKPIPRAATQCRFCELQYECPDYYDVLAVGSGETAELWKQFRLTAEKNGKEPADLCLYTSDKDTFDNGIAVVTYKNDIRTVYTVNVLAGRTTRQMTVVGTEGMAEADLKRGSIQVTERHSERKYRYDLLEMMRSGHGGADDRIIRNFLHTCHTGKKPRSSWSEGRLALQVALAARESGATGKVVKL